MTLEPILQQYPHPYLTDLELDTLMDGSPDSRYSKVKRLLAKGSLLHVRRGLYCLPDKQKTHPFELAQYIYGPSYISLESALSFHHLIPEAVYTVTSVTSKRSKEFNTPLGMFSYQHLPPEGFYTQVNLQTENGYSFFIAKPWKAICDYVYCYKKEWGSFAPLVQSLRISRDALPILRDEEIVLLTEYYHHSRITKFLKGIRNER